MQTATLFFCLAIGCAQLLSQTPEHMAHPDSTAESHIVLVEPAMTPGSTLFLLPPHLEEPLQFSSPTFFFKESGSTIVSPDFGRRLEVRPDLLAPLRAQWAREAQMGTFRKILGSIQLGGVAYLAYRQFAKSGIMTARPRPVKGSRK